MTRPLISLDSCSILHLLDPESVWYPHLRPLYDEAMAGNHSVVISEVSIAECRRLKVDGRELPPERAAEILGKFFMRLFIVRRGVTSRESALAGRLIEQHDIGTCDALIASTAAYAGAHTLYTTDGCTRRRKAGKLLSVGMVETEDGKRMRVEPPNLAKCDELKAGTPHDTN